MKVTALVSAYYASEFIDSRLDNLQSLEVQPEIIIVAQAGSYEEQSAHAHGIEPIITRDIPTISKAWNMAIKAATGDYLTNANCDDILYIGALSSMVKTLDMTGAALVYSGYRVLRDNHLSEKWRYQIEGKMTGCIIGPFPMWRRNLHKKYGYFDETFQSAADYEFWLRLNRAGEKFVYIQELLGCYRWRAGSIEHRDMVISGLEAMRCERMYP